MHVFVLPVGLVISYLFVSSFCDKEGDLRLSEALAPSEYSYLNPSVLSTWAGPLHWKIKTGTKDSKNVESKSNSGNLTFM